MKAIIETGGKQYVVSPGDKINIEKIIAESAKEHIIKKVLLVKKEDGSSLLVSLILIMLLSLQRLLINLKTKKLKFSN